MWSVQERKKILMPISIFWMGEQILELPQIFMCYAYLETILKTDEQSWPAVAQCDTYIWHFLWKQPQGCCLPSAGVILVSWGRVGEGRNVLVYKRPKTKPEIAGELSHFFSQLSSQVPNGVQIILHGEGEIHQIVQIYGIILYLSNLHVERGWVTCGGSRSFAS